MYFSRNCVLDHGVRLARESTVLSIIMLYDMQNGITHIGSSRCTPLPEIGSLYTLDKNYVDYYIMCIFLNKSLLHIKYHS